MPFPVCYVSIQYFKELFNPPQLRGLLICSWLGFNPVQPFLKNIFRLNGAQR
jgi:hypothetical protein